MATFEETSEYIRNKFWDFLETYQDVVQGGEPVLFYIQQLQSMKEEDKTTMYVDYEHLSNFDPELAELVQEHYYRLDPVLRKALQNFVRVHMADHVQDEDDNDKEFWVSFYNMPLIERMRDLKAGKLGRLVSFAGTVTRNSEVRPELYLATFKCMDCGDRIRNVEQQFKYTQPLICSNSTCGNRQHWELIREESAFVDWQRAKVQECADEVPAGSLPRTADVILRHDIVESVRAGDKVVFTGNVIVVPDVAAISTPGERVEASMNKGGQGGATEGVAGLKYLGSRELTYKLAFLASSTQASDDKLGMVNIRAEDIATPEELLGAMSGAERDEIVLMKRNARLYEDLAKSLAPGVFGHEDVKRAVLLMLLGGVHKETSEGISLRGDINVAIIGDPSCAKSQILKYVANFLPRAVYTSGKSSSAAGLTASVVKEQDSNEFCIEAGALMLADNGICCIDEFDKMDVKDQVAIHEAMEQQTISIAKAGIQATLNARTSILAAANPVGGRYDRSKPLRYNVALPPAILSRFDLLHIMIDEPDDVLDSQVARHIVNVHQKKDQAFNAPYTMTQIQRYIKFARSLKPRMTPEAKEMLVEGYKRLRTEDAVPGSSTSYRITVRQLEALVRLSEALARLRCSDVILPQYVREAVRLVKNSIIAIESPEAEVDDVDFIDDLEEIHDVVERFRRNEQTAAQPARLEQGGAEAGPASQAEGRAAQGTAAGHSGQAEGGQEGREPLAEQRREAEAGISALQQQRQPTRVSQKKVDQVKNLLVMRLRELEDGGGGTSAAIGDIEVAAMSQHDLMTWYFDYQTARQAYTSNEEVQAEVVLVTKIVQHLIRKEAVLVVVETPGRNEGEDDASYARRQQRDRILAINPNYTIE